MTIAFLASGGVLGHSRVLSTAATAGQAFIGRRMNSCDT